MIRMPIPRLRNKIFIFFDHDCINDSTYLKNGTALFIGISISSLSTQRSPEYPTVNAMVQHLALRSAACYSLIFFWICKWATDTTLSCYQELRPQIILHVSHLNGNWLWFCSNVLFLMWKELSLTVYCPLEDAPPFLYAEKGSKEFLDQWFQPSWDFDHLWQLQVIWFFPKYFYFGLWEPFWSHLFKDEKSRVVG